MGQPSEFTPAQDYADFQTNNPGSFVAGSDLDVDFAAVKVTLDQIRTNLALLQKDDGTIANSTVTVDSLNADILALFTIGASTVRGQWLTATAYAVLDVVTDSGIVYVCAEAHTSGVLATDVTAVKWLVLSGGSQPLDTDLTAIAALVSAADKIPYATGAGTWSLANFTAYGRTLAGLADVAALLSNLSLSTAAKTDAANTFTNNAGQTIQSSNAAGTGAILNMDHFSASPDIGDNIALIKAFGRNDAGTPEIIEYARLAALILDETDGTEDGRWNILTMVNGTLTNVLFIAEGIHAPGLSDPGVGKANFTGVQTNGVLHDPATQAEMEAGSDATLAALVTAGRQHFHPAHPKVVCTVTLASGTPVAVNEYNVASYTDNGSGDVTVNFTTAFNDANYTAIPGLTQAPTVDTTTRYVTKIHTKAAGSVRCIIGTEASATPQDEILELVCFGNQA